MTDTLPDTDAEGLSLLPDYALRATGVGRAQSDAPLFYGRVVDFIDVDFFNINFMGFHLTRFWVFNIADASVTVGVLLMLLVHRTMMRDQAGHVEVSTESPVSHPDSSPSA